MSDPNANLNDGGNNGQNNDGGNTPPAWTAQLDKDLQGNERLTSFKTIGEMGKAFLDTEGKLQNALFVPGEKATDEERAAFYSKLGRPEAPEKYSFTKPEGLPEDIPYSPELEGAFKQFAHKINLTDAQAKEIFNWYHNDIVIPSINQEKQGKEATAAAAKAELDKAVNQLKDVWKGDEFKVNLDLASRAFNSIAEKAGIKDEAVDFLANTKINGLALGDHPVFLRVFSTIANSISDDSFNSDRGGRGQGELSEEQKARQRYPKSFPKT